MKQAQTLGKGGSRKGDRKLKFVCQTQCLERIKRFAEGCLAARTFYFAVMSKSNILVTPGGVSKSEENPMLWDPKKCRNVF